MSVDLEAIEARARAAFDSDEWSDDGMAHVLNSQGEWLAEFGAQSNAAFSAAANPQTVLALAAELREARAEAAATLEYHDEWKRAAEAELAEQREENERLRSEIREAEAAHEKYVVTAERWLDRAEKASAEIASLTASNVELQSKLDLQSEEIARHHADFEKWEAMAAKGAGLLAIRERAKEVVDGRWPPITDEQQECARYILGDAAGAAPASDTEQTCQWYSHRHNVFLRCTLPPKHSGDHHLVASVEGSETPDAD